MIESVAYVSFHTSPLLQPGIGDAGGMNVYIDELARTMTGRGIKADVFTRCTDPGLHDVIQVVDGYRVIHIDAGPSRALSTADQAPYVAEFAAGVQAWVDESDATYDVVHSHYWLSGWAGVLLKERWGIPLAHSFHTLGRIKDLSRRPDQAPASLMRIGTEDKVIEMANCIISSTMFEHDDLVQHYGASLEALCVSPPGVNHDVFAPGSRKDARERLGIEFGPILLFVGRIQPLKGLDVAIETLAVLRDQHPTARLVVVGGPSGPEGEAELAHARLLAAKRGVGNEVVWKEPLPHDDLVELYQAADVLIMPSRSESFGLVAAEAQASGLPVVAADIGGLAHVVAHEKSGILVDGWNPVSFAAAIHRILEDEAYAESLAKGAVAHADQFSWDATADRLMELYEGIRAASELGTAG